MYNGPVTFKTATDQIASRMDTPTAMKYTQITAAWDDQFRRRAFFSARVAEADLLGELHRKAQAVVEGKMSRDQARRLIREFFVGDGADALARLGFAPPKDAKGISQLGSIPRLELILDTNVRMAQETGHYRKWETMRDIYPYGVWRVGYSKVHREAHLKRDGKVYAFDHPIWRESPPGGEFNCHCRRDLMTADELAASGLRPVPKSASFQKSSLGFDPGADEWGDVPFGKTVPEDVQKVAEEKLEQDMKIWELDTDRQQFRQDIIENMPQGGDRAAYERLADTLADEYTEDVARYGKPPKVYYAPAAKTQMTQDGRELLIGGDVKEDTPDTFAREVSRKIKFAESMKRGAEWRRDFVEQQKREAELIGDGVRVKKDGYSIDDIVDSVNPNYSKGDEWRLNCQRCVMAAEARRRGLDVAALPILDRYESLCSAYDSRGWPTVFENTTFRDLVDVSASSGARVRQRIIKEMKAYGEGARAIVKVAWRGKDGEAHVFNVENRRGDIIFYDSQRHIDDMSPYFAMIDPSTTEILRVDNRRFSARIKDCCKPHDAN